MFAYCGNNPVSYSDNSGYLRNYSVTIADTGSGYKRTFFNYKDTDYKAEDLVRTKGGDIEKSLAFLDLETISHVDISFARTERVNQTQDILWGCASIVGGFFLSGGISTALEIGGILLTSNSIVEPPNGEYEVYEMIVHYDYYVNYYGSGMRRISSYSALEVYYQKTGVGVGNIYILHSELPTILFEFLM